MDFYVREEHVCIDLNMPLRPFQNGMIQRILLVGCLRQGSIPGHIYMQTFAGVQAPSQSYNDWTYTTTNPLKGVLAKKCRPQFESGLYEDNLGGSSPRPVSIEASGLMRQQNHDR
jgi:hypothetical protein